MSDKERKCKNCIEWEFLEGHGYGCFCMQTMKPLNANECEHYAENIPKYRSKYLGIKEGDPDAE